MSTLGELGERGWIERIAGRLPTGCDVRIGIGDDTAVVAGGDGYELLLTTDCVLEGRHFVAGDSLAAVGHKAVARVLSDVAAMGGEPRWGLIDFTAPEKFPVADAEALFGGAAAVADRFGMGLVGGDTTEGESISLHVFGVGRVPEGSAVLRSTARPGQVVYVTGELGGSRAGSHLTFMPRVGEGAWLRERGWAEAMIDVSDGLATDAAHLARSSGTGVVLVEDHLPVSDAARTAADGRSPIEHALHDGEDFELLFSVRGEDRDRFETAWNDRFDLRCTAIGAVTDDPGQVYLSNAQSEVRILSKGGYEHFSASE